MKKHKVVGMRCDGCGDTVIPGRRETVRRMNETGCSECDFGKLKRCGMEVVEVDDVENALNQLEDGYIPSDMDAEKVQAFKAGVHHAVERVRNQLPTGGDTGTADTGISQEALVECPECRHNAGMHSMGYGDERKGCKGTEDREACQCSLTGEQVRGEVRDDLDLPDDAGVGLLNQTGGNEC